MFLDECNGFQFVSRGEVASAGEAFTWLSSRINSIKNEIRTLDMNFSNMKVPVQITFCQ